MLKNKDSCLRVVETHSDEREDKKKTLESLVNPYVATNCVGQITSINEETGDVYVDYSGNPYKTSLRANLGRPFILDDLKKAFNNVLDVKLEFEGHHPKRPIITDVYYSILTVGKYQNPDKMEDIHISGKRIIIEADTQVVLKSGDVSVTCSAKEGKLISKGVNIISEALHNNKLKGASIAIN